MDELTAPALATRLHTRVIGRHLEVYDEIDSTNSRALLLARQGAPDGLVVLADVQTAGRGRLGRRWQASPGSSLLMSLLLRPPLEPQQAMRATMLCALGALEGIRRIAGLEARVKWPNDILLGEGKVGGVLTEVGLRGRRLDYLIVGMGLNVNLEVASLTDLLAPAASLKSGAGRSIARLALCAAILEAIDARYTRLGEGWSPHEEWRSYLDTLGRQVAVGTPEEVIEGVAEDVDADGALLVRQEDGTLCTVLAGDVTLRGHRVET
ncbi:MAG: biotin--[acetyl-CoA-carboxylase] ligase [Anaerolineae bacterium]